MGLSLLAKRYPRDRRRMHKVTECRAEENYTLWLRFADGLEGHVYVGDIVNNDYFRVLCDAEIFNQVEVDTEDHMVTWIWEGGGLKLDSEDLYRDVASKAQLQ